MLTSLPSNVEAWQSLPAATRGDNAALPAWARMLSAGMPRTTAALLSLDLAQRTVGPVDLTLRAAMRWVAARANRCPFSEKQAAEDAQRNGITESKLASLQQNGRPGWSEAEQAALAFAQDMTVDSDSVTDEAFAGLVKHFGANQAASMVLHMAYANFHDRLLLCLATQGELGEPLPPVDVEFAADSLIISTTAPVFGKPSATRDAEDFEIQHDAEWSAVSYDALQHRLEAQRQKPTRLPLPAWEDVARNLPAGSMQRPNDIVWYHVCMGYAAELAVPFEIFMRTAMGESAGKWDRIFGQGLFWVTTKAVNCPYCMGHCEMNWEVAGLSPDEIARRSRLLGSEDWSSFPPGEQHAFAFARKLAQAPWTVSSDDMSRLERDFGSEAALITVLNACRYHYMTRISNGFQLTLERENVFFDYYGMTNPNGGSIPQPRVAQRTLGREQ